MKNPELAVKRTTSDKLLYHRSEDKYFRDVYFDFDTCTTCKKGLKSLNPA